MAASRVGGKQSTTSIMGFQYKRKFNLSGGKSSNLGFLKRFTLSTSKSYVRQRQLLRIKLRKHKAALGRKAAAAPCNKKQERKTTATDDEILSDSL